MKKFKNVDSNLKLQYMAFSLCNFHEWSLNAMWLEIGLPLFLTASALHIVGMSVEIF